MKLFVKICQSMVLVFFIVLKTTAQDFEVAPVRLEFNAEPGENLTKTLTVKNHGNKKSSFMIALGDFLPSKDGQRVTLAPNSTKRSCANWLSITPSFFELSPGDQVILQVSMLVPSSDNGTAWCMLYIQPTQEQTTWGADKNLNAGVMLSSRIGVLVYQSPSSNTSQSIKISNLMEIERGSSGNRRFSATIENLGEKISICRVYLLASNMVTTEEKQFTPIQVESYPKMTRTVELELPDELLEGKYSLAAIVDYGQKYALEGTQIMIDVFGKQKTPSQDTIPK